MAEIVELWKLVSDVCLSLFDSAKLILYAAQAENLYLFFQVVLTWKILGAETRNPRAEDKVAAKTPATMR